MAMVQKAASKLTMLAQTLVPDLFIPSCSAQTRQRGSEASGGSEHNSFAMAINSVLSPKFQLKMCL